MTGKGGHTGRGGGHTGGPWGDGGHTGGGEPPHCVDPISEVLSPSGHGLQTEEPGLFEYVSIGHGVHSEAPTIEEEVPAGHATQCDDPAVVE